MSPIFTAAPHRHPTWDLPLGILAEPLESGEAGTTQTIGRMRQPGKAQKDYLPALTLMLERRSWKLRFGFDRDFTQHSTAGFLESGEQGLESRMTAQ